MRFDTPLRYVVALEIAGTAHLVVTAADTPAAIAAGFKAVGRPDIADWWPRRQADDFIAPHAQPYRTGGEAYEVGVPFVGTAYVTVDATDPAAAIAAALDQATLDDLDDWRPIRAPVAFHAPSVALEADTEE